MAQNRQQPFSLEGLLKQISDQKFPPVEKWNPEFCGNIDMRIASDGTWFYMGTPITRQRMVRLFASVLRKDEDGKTYLVTPVEKIGISVEDAPFVAISADKIEKDGKPAFVFETNVGDKVVAGSEHPIRISVNEETGEPRPYVLIRGRLEALIGRSVYYQLVDEAEPRQQGDISEIILESDDTEFSLGSWSDA